MCWPVGLLGPHRPPRCKAYANARRGAGGGAGGRSKGELAVGIECNSATRNSRAASSLIRVSTAIIIRRSRRRSRLGQNARCYAVDAPHCTPFSWTTLDCPVGVVAVVAVAVAVFFVARVGLLRNSNCILMRNYVIFARAAKEAITAAH